MSFKTKSSSDAIVEFEFCIEISNSCFELNKLPEILVIKSTGIFLLVLKFSNSTAGLALVVYTAVTFKLASYGFPLQEIVPPFKILNGLLIIPPYLKL